MFKIKISGIVYDIENSVEIKDHHLFIDNKDLGKVGFTLAIAVIEGEYKFTQNKGHLRWETVN